MNNPKKVSSEVALVNAGGVTFAAGGLTTALARSYTSSWSRAAALGICGSVLAMIFIAPRLVENTNLLKSSQKSEIATKNSGKTAAVIKERLIPAKKLVQFRSDATSIS